MVTGARKIKTDAVPFPVPQTHDQVVEAIAEMGRRQRERERIAADMKDELALIKERFEELARPHGEAIQQLFDGIHIYCEAHKDELTQAGKTKTANLSSGTVCWRLSPTRVVLKGIDKVIESLKKFSLDRFLRMKEEIDKNALLADPEAVKGIKGISFVQDELFAVKPFESELEEIG